MVCRSTQLLTVQELVSVGHGVSLLPAMACELDRHPQRRYRRLTGRVPKRTLAMILHKHRYQKPVVRRFLEVVRASASTSGRRRRA